MESRSRIKSELIMLFSLVVVFYLNMVSRVITAPLMPVVEKEFGIGHSDAGLVFMMIAIGYALGLISSGFISSRLTHRKTILVSSVSMGVLMLLIAISDGLWMIRAELFIIGIFSGFYLPSGITTFTSEIDSAHWGKATSIHEMAPNLSFVTAPLIAEGLLIFMSWRAIMASVGIFSIVAGLVFVSFTAAGDFKGDAPTFGNFRLFARNRDFWIIAFLFGAAIGLTMGVYNMMPLYLSTERGIDRSTANTLLGLSRISVIPLVFVSGWIVDRFGVKLTMAVVMLFSGVALILLGTLPGKWVILMVFLQPMLTGSFFPPGFAALSKIVPNQARSLAVSLAIFVAYLTGAGFIPLLLGVFGDVGMFSFAFILIGVSILINLFFIHRLELRKMDTHELSGGV